MARGTRRIKSVEDSIRDTDEPEHRLKKSLSALDLTVFGVGVVIGAGIFVVTGEVAQKQSGPAVAISFVIAGITCALAALCYAEFASTVPVAGSAYTFSYATFGELIAWIIGWDWSSSSRSAPPPCPRAGPVTSHSCSATSVSRCLAGSRARARSTCPPWCSPWR